MVVLETANSHRTIDTANEFYSYDYTTGQEVDLTENTLTNALLGIITENKPKVYFTIGHEEYSIEAELASLNTSLKYESYNIDTVNLLTSGKVPEDCNLLILMSPVKDFAESEVNAILDYINKGGNLIITSDVGNIAESYANLQKIYDVYGVKLNHTGYVFETDETKIRSNYNSIFMPTLSSTNYITTDVYSDGGIWLIYAGRLEFVSDEQLTALNVNREDLVTSSEQALFITDISKSASEAAKTSEKGKTVIASILTKTITPKVEAAEGVEAKEAVESKLLVMANASFITDFIMPEINSNSPLSNLANNKDFMLNAVASLTDKEDILKIRKDMSNSTYIPTVEEHTIIMIIIFAVPVAIIVAGVVIWNLRRRKR